MYFVINHFILKEKNVYVAGNWSSIPKKLISKYASAENAQLTQIHIVEKSLECVLLAPGTKIDNKHTHSFEICLFLFSILILILVKHCKIEVMLTVLNACRLEMSLHMAMCLDTAQRYVNCLFFRTVMSISVFLFISSALLEHTHRER